MSTLNVSFVCYLAFHYRQLLPLLDEHLSGNDKEIIPHVLMYEYCVFVCENIGAEDWILSLLQTLEENFEANGGDEISNLIAVSFIEGISYSTVTDAFFTENLGPKTSKHYNLITAPYRI